MVLRKMKILRKSKNGQESNLTSCKYHKYTSSAKNYFILLNISAYYLSSDNSVKIQIKSNFVSIVQTFIFDIIQINLVTLLIWIF